MSGRDDGGNERQATNNNNDDEIDGASSFLYHTPSRSHLV